LLGDFGEFVRNVVSDADKLESLGKTGLERCKEYQRHYYRERHNSEIPDYLLTRRVIENLQYRLLMLKDNFIKTQSGKQLAIPLHNELLQELGQLYIDNFEIYKAENDVTLKFFNILKVKTNVYDENFASVSNIEDKIHITAHIKVNLPDVYNSNFKDVYTMSALFLHADNIRHIYDRNNKDCPKWFLEKYAQHINK